MRLTQELGVDAERVHVIAHGAFAHLAELPAAPPPFPTDKRVVLFFGLLRPYKGLDVLLQAWRGIDDAELWIVGMPRMDVAALMADAPPNVRLVPRFVADAELPAYFARADLVVLPYREIEQSGVLFTALAFGKPLLVSDVGGFAELAERGAAHAVAPGDPRALHDALTQLLADPAALARSARAGARCGAGRLRLAGDRRSARSRCTSSCCTPERRRPHEPRALSPSRTRGPVLRLFRGVGRTPPIPGRPSPASNARVTLGATRIASSRAISTISSSRRTRPLPASTT